MSLDNRYAALSSTEEAPGMRSEKRALAPRESAPLESKIATSAAVMERNIHHTEKSQSVQHESTALLAEEKPVEGSKPEATFPGVNVSAILADVDEHLLPTGLVPFQPDSTFTPLATVCSSNVTCPATIDSAYSSASWLDKDLAGFDTRQNHDAPKNFSNPTLELPPGEPQFSAAQLDDHRRIIDDFFGPQSFSIELPNGNTTLTVPPPILQKRGWPSPTNSPAAPTTRDRQSRFFPTLPNVPPEIFKSDHRAQVETHYSFPLLYHAPDPTSWGLPTLAPSTDIIKPRIKKSPPPPIAINHSPLSSPILIRDTPSYFDSCFNPSLDSISDFQIPPPEADVIGSDDSKDSGKNLIPTTQQFEPTNEPQMQNIHSPKLSIVESPHREDTGVTNGERDGGKEVDKLETWLNNCYKHIDAEVRRGIEALEKKAQDIEARGRRIQRETEALERRISLDAETWEGLESEFWGVV